MTETLAKRYTDDQILQALTLTAQQSAAKAAQQLQIPVLTVRGWMKGTHRDRYLALREQYAAQEQKELAAESADIAKLAASKQLEILHGLDTQGVSKRPDEAARVVMNLGKAFSTAVDKMQLLRDKPTANVNHIKNIEELDASMTQRFGKKWTDAIDSTAEEIDEGEAA